MLGLPSVSCGLLVLKQAASRQNALPKLEFKTKKGPAPVGAGPFEKA